MEWRNGRDGEGSHKESSALATYRNALNDFVGMLGNREVVESNLLRHYDSLIQNCERSREDALLAQGTASLWQKSHNDIQKRLVAVEMELQELKTANASKSFIFVLLDGDGAIFRDEFIRKGAEGGEEAAHLLKNRVQQYIKEIDATANTDYIVAQIVFNLDGLQKALHASDTIRQPDLVSFARGFCRVQPLFSMVDVGSGKEQTDAKVKRMFELMIANHQCNHMIWGPTHDNGYVRLLKEVAGNPAVHAKLTLLEATPPAAEFTELTYKTTRFPDIFRSEMIPSKPVYSMTSAPAGPAHSNSCSASSMSTGAASPSLSYGVPSTAVAKPSAVAQVKIPQSPRSLAVRVDAKSTYASLGRSSTGGAAIDIKTKRKASASRHYMLLNKDNRRVDEPIKFDPGVMELFKKDSKYNGNHCNKYHLRNMCNDGNKCNFRHEHLDKDKMLCLRALTRHIACRDSHCPDVFCTLGHHCLHPDACSFGSRCKFSHLHDDQFDMVPTLKIYEDGEREVLV